jgi:hypothetical protein
VHLGNVRGHPRKARLELDLAQQGTTKYLRDFARSCVMILLHAQ